VIVSGEVTNVYPNKDTSNGAVRDWFMVLETQSKQQFSIPISTGLARQWMSRGKPHPTEMLFGEIVASGLLWTFAPNYDYGQMRINEPEDIKLVQDLPLLNIDTPNALKDNLGKGVRLCAKLGKQDPKTKLSSLSISGTEKLYLSLPDYISIELSPLDGKEVELRGILFASWPIAGSYQISLYQAENLKQVSSCPTK
jgi:hypothetical protein